MRIINWLCRKQNKPKPVVDSFMEDFYEGDWFRY